MKRYYDEQWNIMFDRLRAFKDVNGHVMVPKRYPAHPRLGTWVSLGSSSAAALERFIDSHTFLFTWCLNFLTPILSVIQPDFSKGPHGKGFPAAIRCTNSIHCSLTCIFACFCEATHPVPQAHVRNEEDGVDSRGRVCHEVLQWRSDISLDRRTSSSLGKYRFCMEHARRRKGCRCWTNDSQLIRRPMGKLANAVVCSHSCMLIILTSTYIIFTRCMDIRM
jgi:hypothetical protein